MSKIISRFVLIDFEIWKCSYMLSQRYPSAKVEGPKDDECDLVDFGPVWAKEGEEDNDGKENDANHGISVVQEENFKARNSTANHIGTDHGISVRQEGSIV